MRIDVTKQQRPRDGIKRLALTLLRLGLAIGLLLYLSLSGAISWTALGGLARAWPLALAALLLVGADHLLVAWRLCLLLRARGFHLSLPAAIRLTLIGVFFSACLPGAVGGDVLKIYYAAAGTPGRRTEVATILMLDRAVGMFALLLWPLLLAPWFADLLGGSEVLRGLLVAAAALVGGMVLGLLTCSASVLRRGRLPILLRRLPLGGRAERALETVRAYRRNPGALAAALGIALLAHGLLIGALLLLATATDPGAFAWQMSLLVPLGLLANTLPLTPGGLGVGEAAFAELFALAGLRGGAEILLGWRVLNAVPGLVGLLFYLQGRRRFVHELPPLGAEEGTPAEARAPLLSR
jgi:uncharacterized membrane protein YbhN (UPF0104 family)